MYVRPHFQTRVLYDIICQVTSVAFNRKGDQVFSGCLDNNVHCWDLRRGKVQHVLRGHRDTVTGVRLSPDGNFLLSNAADNSLRK